MNNSTVTREVFDGFSGLAPSLSRGKGSTRLDNFRVLADGSLEKREGMRQIASLPSEVRGIHGFVDGEEEILLAAAGRELYRITPSGEVVSSSVCFDTEVGEVRFFEYEGRLYMLDGACLYRYEGGSEATKAVGYTPLYGKDWSPFNTERPIYEPINYLSPRVRVHFKLSSGAFYLYLGMAVREVVWVQTDAGTMDPSNYSLNSTKERLDLKNAAEGSFVEICVLLEEQYYLDSDFLSCGSAEVYESFENSKVFWYGGREPSKLYVSRSLAVETAVRDKMFFSDSCALYFPKTQRLTFGSGQPISAIKRIYDRMMVFFPSSLWVTERLDEVESDRVLFSPICHHMGCSAKDAVLLTGAASPISVACSGIYRWKIDADLLDECITRKLSDDIGGLLSEGFLENAELCHNRRRGELWLRDKSKTDGLIFVYDLERERFYAFSGIEADRLFSFGDGIGATRGGEVYLFDEALAVDRFADHEREIIGVYESGWLSFEGVGSEKRLSSLLLTAELHGGTLCAELGDARSLTKLKLHEEDADAPDIYEQRMPTSRFRAAKLTLTAGGAARQRIYRAELLAQKGKQ